MVKIKSKKQKLTKTPDTTPTKPEKKLVKKKKTQTPTPQNNPQTPPPTSDSELDSPQTLQTLLEPYPKDQLINFIIEAALKDSNLYTRILQTADKDVSHRKIFIHGLGWDTTKQTLLSEFASFGDIEDCNVVTDRVTGKAKGFGFIVFSSRKGAAKALKQPRKKIGNRIVSCQLASIGPIGAPQNSDTSGRKIYVSNVGSDVDSEKLRKFFEGFGEIETGPLGFDMQTGKSRGFALFVYRTAEGAKKVLEEPYKMFEGHQLHCQWAAEGKGKVTASVTTVVQPVPAGPVAQMGLYNPMYAAMLANQTQMGLGLGYGGFAGGIGQMGGSFGGLPMGLGGLGGSQSVLGGYGASGGPVVPGSQLGQSSSTRTGGAFGGYPSY